QIRKTAAADTHKPRGKYTILTTIAEKYTHNIGYPGTTNAAMDEVFSKYLIPQMFAQVSQGKMSATDSVKSINSQVKDIYAKWRARGKCCPPRCRRGRNARPRPRWAERDDDLLSATLLLARPGLFDVVEVVRLDVYPDAPGEKMPQQLATG